MLKGITITYLRKLRVGTDDFNAPIYDLIGEPVENVLVSPTTSDDVVNSIDLTGKKLVYTLAIPKGDSHDWEDCIVEFFGKRFKSFGFPIQGIEDNIPLSWNKKVTVELYE
jgi:hypothetical protein